MPPDKQTPKNRAGDDETRWLSSDDIDRLIERHRRINAAETSFRLLIDDLSAEVQAAAEAERETKRPEQH